MLRFVSLVLIFVLVASAGFASTVEATPNFWTEFDIVFWQTAPFAIFWGYVIGSQLAGGGAVNWSPIMSTALSVSALNAYFYAGRLTNTSRIVK